MKTASVQIGGKMALSLHVAMPFWSAKKKARKWHAFGTQMPVLASVWESGSARSSQATIRNRKIEDLVTPHQIQTAKEKIVEHFYNVDEGIVENSVV